MRTLFVIKLSTALLCCLYLSACDEQAHPEQEGQEGDHQQHPHKIVVTSPLARDVVSTEQYVCQIHSRRHVEIRALETGYLEEIGIKEGQTVEAGDVMFKTVPILHQAKLETEAAEAELAQINFNNTELLANSDVVSKQELALRRAELLRAQAKVKRAQAKLNFTTLRAPFDGIIDRQLQQQGSLVEEGDILSTISDNEVMWVYFNVPEAGYLKYKTRLESSPDDLTIELKLANGQIFDQPGKIGAIAAEFNNETGNIAFRADFDNPTGLLRHGQTGTILMHRVVPGAIVIPQRATYDILAKQYVFVIEPLGRQSETHAAVAAGAVGRQQTKSALAQHDHAGHGKGQDGQGARAKRGTVRQREIVVEEEMDDVYVIKSGLQVGDKVVFEGIRQVRDGDEVEYVYTPPEVVLQHLKFHAE